MWRKEICQYISKKYYAICLVKKGKYRDYKDLPLKCITNDK